LGLGLIYTFDEYLRPSLDTGEGESQKASVLLRPLPEEGWDAYSATACFEGRRAPTSTLPREGREKVRRPRYCSFPFWGKAGMGAAPAFGDGLF
jgi:hypothetical protein